MADLALVWRAGAGRGLQCRRVPAGAGLQERHPLDEQVGARPAVKRGKMVNRTFGKPESQLRERHDASDFDTKTQDKLEAEKADE
jgi:hypothetical protein